MATRYKSPKHRVSTEARVVLKKRIRFVDIPKFREKYAKKQKWKCPICERDLGKLITTLDHDHETGFLRGTLCNNCNGLEGKLSTILKRLDVGKIGFDKLLQNLAAYRHPDNLKKKYIHPHAETLSEQRDRQNARARKRYKEKKAMDNGRLPVKKKQKRKKR